MSGNATRGWSGALIVALVLLLVASVVSPGPNFALVSRTALAISRRAAIGAAFGIAAGATVYVCLAMFGASAAIERVPWLQEVARVVGGLFLVYIALRVFATHTSEDETHGVLTSKKGFRYGFPLGLSTSLSNPQLIAFFLSIFASFDLLQTPPTTQVTVIVVCTGIEVTWYSLVALFLGRDGPRRFYAKYRRLLDLLFCFLLAALGLLSFYEGARELLAGSSHAFVAASVLLTGTASSTPHIVHDRSRCR